ncbi:MAG: hypothetical protein JNM95_00425 [Chitinophagaceae bacterium]|nr:hypothetical protein [Chitinophagaceae bacterium]
MNTSIQIPSDFSSDSRVWIFQSNRKFGEQEELEINEQLYNFYVQWQTHGKDIKGWAKLFYHQFVVVVADETFSGVSGCSTDSMMRVIKSFERQYQVDLFDRLTITFLLEDRVEPLPMNQVKYALEKGYIETDTPLFNNLVATKAEFEEGWLTPLNKSWLWERIIKS